LPISFIYKITNRQLVFTTSTWEENQIPFLHFLLSFSILFFNKQKVLNFHLNMLFTKKYVNREITFFFFKYYMQQPRIYIVERFVLVSFIQRSFDSWIYTYLCN
jgi:hypothetical protein